MIGMGDLYEREIEREECGVRMCDCGAEFVPAAPTEPCDECKIRESRRIHPICVCGKLAKFVADVISGGQVLERRPWCSEDCARGDEDPDDPVVVDCIVEPGALEAIVKLRPCWCRVPSCPWCPKCGWKA
jgi:hypothetical protein